MSEECPINAIKTADNILISWSGDPETFKKHSSVIVSALDDSSLTWKNDRSRPPSTPNFTVNFVELSDEGELKLSISGDGPTRQHIFLHLYFVSVETFEDYRQIRPQVSEWFARLCEAGNQNWLIILDSSKAKERKARSSMVDKVRTDFPKFSSGASILGASRISSSNSNLPAQIQSAMLESLTFYKDSLSNEITKVEEEWRKCVEGFQPTRLLNIRFRLCTFYWALLLVEQCLEELEKMGDFVHFFLTNDKESPMPMAVALFGDKAPLIGEAMHGDHLKLNSSVADWRCFIVAHQIRANFYLLNHRLGTSPGDGNTRLGASSTTHLNVADVDRDTSPQRRQKSASPARRPKEKLGEDLNSTTQHIRRDLASFILKQLLDAFHSFVVEVSITKASYNVSQLHLLRILWFEEVIALCQCNSLPMGELASAEPVGHFYMLLLSAKCDSVAGLCASIVENDNEVVTSSCAGWLAEESLAASLESSRGVRGKLLRAFSDRNKFCELAEKWLVDSRQLLRKRHWNGHIRLVNDSLIKLYSSDVGSLSGPKGKCFECLVENWHLRFTLLDSVGSKAFGAGAPSPYAVMLLDGSYDKLLDRDKELHVDLLLSVLPGRNEVYAKKLATVLSTLSERITRSNTSWKLAPSVAFPVRVTAIGGNGLTAAFLLHFTITVEMRIECDLPPLFTRDVELVAVYRKLRLGETRYLAGPLFESSSLIGAESKTDRVQALRTVAGTVTKRHAGRLEVDVDANGESGEDEEECILLRATSEYLKSPIKLEGEAGYTGCYVLSRIELRLARGLVFSIDCAFEAADSTRKPSSVYLLVESKKPLVELEAVDASVSASECMSQTRATLYSGIVQQVRLRLTFGSLATRECTRLKMVQIATKPSIEFLLADGSWAQEGFYSIPDTNKRDDYYSLPVFLFAPIDGMNNVDQQVLESQKEIEVDWMGHQWKFPLSFTPIMNLKTTTSLLGDRVLFELQVQRGSDPYGNENIRPLKVELFQDQSVAKDPVEAVLLNSKPFEPIRARSTYQFVWQLPMSKIGKTIPITHFIHLKYRVESQRSGMPGERMAGEQRGEFLEELVGREYAFDNKLSFTVQKVEYEICAHVLSDRPQLVLCRIDTPCDLIVSLRSLTSHRAESIIAVVEVDREYWSTVDRFKVVNIKESGVGQTNFSIVPKKVGFLPYPLVYIHRQTPGDGHNERQSLTSEESMFGERLTSFHRNQGKQIHVLGPLSTTGDDASSGSIGGASTGSSQPNSSKKSLKTQAKDKIHAVQKLFE